MKELQTELPLYGLLMLLLAYGGYQEWPRWFPVNDSAPATESPRPVPTLAEPAPSPTFPSIQLLAGKDREWISQALGKPDKCEDETISRVGTVPACSYQGGKIEVVYINGLADWIDVNEVGLPFEPDSLRAFGFSSVPAPSVQNEQMISWSEIAGFRGINYGKGLGNTISFVHFKWKTD